MALEIRVEAQTGPATAAVDKLDKSLAKLGNDARTAGAEVARLGRSLDPVSAGMNLLNPSINNASKSLERVKSTAGTAGQSLQNLGRIAQDAPFGFIGIQNNINPLLESFQRLKVETGSSSAAFKALGSSLLGAGGLGLAVSVATGLLTIFAQNGLFSTSKAADEATEAIKKYKDNIKGIFSEAGKEAGEVLSLIAVLKSETETRQRKLQALKDLKEIQPEIFGQLKLEKDAVIGLDVAYKAYIANFKNVIAAKIIQAQIEAKVTKLLEKQGATQSKLSQQLLAGLRTSAQQMAANGQGGFLQKLDDKARSTTKEIAVLNKEIEDLVSQLVPLSKNVEIKIDKDKKAKKDVETITDVLNKLGHELYALSSQEILFKTDESKKKVEEIEKTVDKLITKFSVSANSPLIEKLLGLRDPFILNQLNAILKKAEQVENLRAFKVELPLDIVPIKPKFLIDPSLIEADMVKQLGDLGITKGLQDGINVAVTALRFPQLTALLESAKQGFAELSARLTGVLESTIEASLVNVGNIIGESIGKALQGQALSVKDIFGSVFQIIGDGLKAFGRALIEYGIALKVIKLAIKNPITAILGGIALIAAGTLLQSAVPKFATGVGNFAGGSAIVGERGPELVNLPTGSDVIPNGRLNAIGSDTAGGTLSCVVRGQDLIFVLNQANRSNGRNGFSTLG